MLLFGNELSVSGLFWFCLCHPKFKNRDISLKPQDFLLISWKFATINLHLLMATIGWN